MHAWYTKVAFSFWFDAYREMGEVQENFFIPNVFHYKLLSIEQTFMLVLVHSIIHQTPEMALGRAVKMTCLKSFSL
jgi:hypothetical protein